VKGKKLKWRGFRKQLLELGSDSLDNQKKNLLSFFNNWKTDLEQLDDVCVMGVKF
jgi:hypothetical protein